MEQKRVSFEVAKAIKKAGYPQGKTDKIYLLSPIDVDLACREFGLLPLNGDYKIGEMLNSARYSKYGIITCDAPTYLDVLLWLWQVKGIHIDIVSSKLGTQMDIWDSEQHNIMGDNTVFYSSPEEAIEAAIKYLVDNDLIK